jgi:hypothetical protein
VSEIFEFEWGVDQHGYALEDRSPGPLLLSLSGEDDPEQDRAYERDGWNKVIRQRGGPVKYYRPMEHSGLWRRMADVPDSPAGALEFVREFGLLDDRKTGKETVGFIMNTARVLRGIAHALDITSPQIAANIFNMHARPQVTARISPPQQGARRLNFDLVPLTLRSALYLQAGNAIAGDLKFRRCLNCPEWFQVGSGAATERRKFCTNRCRVAWSRKNFASAAT